MKDMDFVATLVELEQMLATLSRGYKAMEEKSWTPLETRLLELMTLELTDLCELVGQELSNVSTLSLTTQVADRRCCELVFFLDRMKKPINTTEQGLLTTLQHRTHSQLKLLVLLGGLRPASPEAESMSPMG